MAGRKKQDALGYLHKKYFSGPEAKAELEEARESASVARRLHELRIQAGLTQRELADLVGTTHTAISRLENDDYEGHSLATLRKIAAAVGRRVEVRFVPIKRVKRGRAPASRPSARHGGW